MERTLLHGMHGLPGSIVELLQTQLFLPIKHEGRLNNEKLGVPK